MTREPQADPAAVDAVLAVSRPMIAVAMKSLSPAAEETTAAQFRALGVLASHRPWRLVDLAAAQRAVAETFRDFADAAGEVPAGQWPEPVPARTLVRPGRPVPRVQPIRARVQERP